MRQTGPMRSGISPKSSFADQFSNPQEHVYAINRRHRRPPAPDIVHPHSPVSPHSSPLLCFATASTPVSPPCRLPPPLDGFSRHDLAPHALLPQMVIPLLPRPTHTETLVTESCRMGPWDRSIRTDMADCLRNSREILVEFTVVYFYRGDLDRVPLGAV